MQLPGERAVQREEENRRLGIEVPGSVDQRTSTRWRNRSDSRTCWTELQMTLQIRVNGEIGEVECDPDTPLLYALRNDLGLVGTRFRLWRRYLRILHGVD